jgi:hypothetical protein
MDTGTGVPAESSEPGDERYFFKTARSASVVAAFVGFVLGSYGLFWGLAPLAAGFGLAVALFWGWDWVIRANLTADKLRQEKNKGRYASTTILWFALVKYPLVGLLIWWFTQVFSVRQMIVFAGGFMLLHLVILLRALGKKLTTPKNR